MFKTYLYNLLLPKIFKKEYEAKIPRSGKKGEQVDAYHLALDKNGDPFFGATDYKNEKLIGLRWDGNSYTIEESINLAEFESLEFWLIHYIGTRDVVYRNIYCFALSYFTKFSYCRIWLQNILNSIAQFRFNLKKIRPKNGIIILKFLKNYHLKINSDGISVKTLMEELYSKRIIFHRLKDDTEKDLKLKLDSFIDSGELELNRYKYRIKGKGITTITNIRKENRRLILSIIFKVIGGLLTLLLIIVGLVQTGHIKLPFLHDFSNSKTNGAVSEIPINNDSTAVNDTIKQSFALDSDSLDQK